MVKYKEKRYNVDTIIANLIDLGYVKVEDMRKSLFVQCDMHHTCLKDCPAKNVIDLCTIEQGSTLGEFLRDPGSCYHNQHTDGEYKEASIKKV